MSSDRCNNGSLGQVSTVSVQSSSAVNRISGSACAAEAFPLLPGGDDAGVVASEKASNTLQNTMWSDVRTDISNNIRVHTMNVHTYTSTDTSHIPSPHTYPVSFAPSPSILPIPACSDTPIHTSMPAPVDASSAAADALLDSTHPTQANIDSIHMGNMGFQAWGRSGI